MSTQPLQRLDDDKSFECFALLRAEEPAS